MAEGQRELEKARTETTAAHHGSWCAAAAHQRITTLEAKLNKAVADSRYASERYGEEVAEVAELDKKLSTTLDQNSKNTIQLEVSTKEIEELHNQLVTLKERNIRNDTLIREQKKENLLQQGRIKNLEDKRLEEKAETFNPTFHSYKRRPKKCRPRSTWRKVPPQQIQPSRLQRATNLKENRTLSP